MGPTLVARAPPGASARELVRFEPENTHARRRQPPTGATPLRFARRLAMALKILGWGTMVGVAFLAITSLKTWMAPLASRAAQMNLDYAQRDAANKHLKTARQASSES